MWYDLSMPYKDPERQKEFQRLWMSQRRLDWIAEQGSVCAKCSGEEGPWEIDHVDPTTKVSHRVWSWAKEKREKELAKCQLLCSVCHWKKTAGENSGLTFVHGTSTAYRYGCRCGECNLYKKQENAKRYK